MHWEIAAGIAIVTGFGIYRIARDAYKVKDNPTPDPALDPNAIDTSLSYIAADGAIEGIWPRVGTAIAKGLEAIAHHFHH